MVVGSLEFFRQIDVSLNHARMPEKVRSLRLHQEKVSRFLDYQEIITNGRFLRDRARNLLVIEIVKNILIDLLNHSFN